jgi:hypothetical protein
VVPACSGCANAGNEVLKLGSIARELSYNDYQGSRGARGDSSDRNVITSSIARRLPPKATRPTRGRISPPAPTECARQRGARSTRLCLDIRTAVG